MGLHAKGNAVVQKLKIELSGKGNIRHQENKGAEVYSVFDVITNITKQKNASDVWQGLGQRYPESFSPQVFDKIGSGDFIKFLRKDGKKSAKQHQ